MNLKPTLMMNLGPTPKLTRSIALTVLLFLLSTSAAFAAAPTCSDLFSAPTTARSNGRALDTVKQIKLMAYNVENMFLKLGKFEHFTPEQFKKMTDSSRKPENELRGLAQAIEDENPDFIVMEEVEDFETLAYFSKTYLADTYQAFLVDGNDQRGIQIGYLVKRDLPLKVSLESHKDATWVDPKDRVVRPLFSRDAPALMIRRQTDAANSAPALIFIGNHAKSQRDRQGDPKSTVLRGAQMKEIASIVDDYQTKYGKDVPIVVGGDFNIDVRQSPEVGPIRERMIDPFDLKNTRALDRVTHTYHPRRGNTELHQLDALFLTPSLADNVIDIETYRYKDANGMAKPLPRTFDERSKNPSDHFPIVVTLSTDDIFPEAHGF